MIATVSGILIVVLAMVGTFGYRGGPYLGILGYLVFPAFFALGLALMLVGWRSARRRAARAVAAGQPPPGPPVIDFGKPRTRRLLIVGAAAAASSVVVLSVVERVREEGLQAHQARSWGPALVFERLWREQRMPELLRRLAGDRRFGFDVERVAFALALQRLCAPGSDLQGSAWLCTVPPGRRRRSCSRWAAGAEYFFSPHFSLQVFPALQLQTNRTSTGLVTSIGLHWYF